MLHSIAVKENKAHFYTFPFMATLSTLFTPKRGFCHATSRTQQECAQESDEDLATRNVLSAMFQKAKSRAEALEQWAQEWYTKPRTSHAYRLALSKPPYGFSHPLWAVALKAKPPPLAQPSAQPYSSLLGTPLQQNTQGGSNRILSHLTSYASAALRDTPSPTSYLTVTSQLAQLVPP